MADIFSLLSLSSSSRAFSALSSLPQTARDVSDRPASPPRKIARLDVATHAHTAASSARAGRSDSFEKRGPVIIRVVGHLIKPTPNSSLDGEYALMRHAVKVLLTPEENTPLSETYDRISRACRAVVSEAGKGEGLYDYLKMELERCVRTMASMLVTDTRKGMDWLAPFTDACAWFEKQVGLLQSLLAYLDTLYVTTSPKLVHIKHLADTLFISTVIGHSQISQAIINGLSDWLEWERNNHAQHALRPRVKQLVRHLYAHGLYNDMIQSTYLNLTHTFYTAESNVLADSGMKANDFLRHAQTRSQEEHERASDVLVESSVQDVRDTTETALLTGRLQWIAKDGLEVLMENQKEEELKKMYKLFAKVGGLKVLSVSFKTYVQKAVKGIVTDTARDDEMVPRLLAFKAFCDRLVAHAFVEEFVTPQASSSKMVVSESVQVNRDFAYGLTDAFQAGFKTRRIKPAEMIAKHMDKALRSGQKGKSDEAFLGELEEVLSLYRYTDDLDVFRTFYQRGLAKRLLLGRSASNAIEIRVLTMLKQKYDPEFSMSEQMFKDLETSEERISKFRQKRGAASSIQKLNVMVLQHSAWPFPPRKSDVDLPQWMQRDLTEFAKFYIELHQGRKLDWDHSSGTATLKAQFNKGEKELTVSLYQAIVLLLFNEEPQRTYAEIKEHTHLDDAELQRTLQSLACGKRRVLKKRPAGRDVNKTDRFIFDADFTDPRFQVHINSIQARETEEETKRTTNSIEQDRKHALDAAIVRVMKAKKELMYEQLKTATIDAVKNHFVPEVSMIKQRIAVLVEQEYLTRDEDDMNKYIYLA